MHPINFAIGDNFHGSLLIIDADKVADRLGTQKPGFPEKPGFLILALRDLIADRKAPGCGPMFGQQDLKIHPIAFFSSFNLQGPVSGLQ